MTISNPSNRVVFNGPGNGFPYNLPVFADSDIYVEILTDDNDTIIPDLDGAGTYDFAISGTFDASQFRYPDGVTVTLNNALPAGYSIVIENRVNPTQATDYVNGGPLNAERLETDIDRVVVMVQAAFNAFFDLVRVTPAAGLTLPPLVPDALKFLRWNAAADAIETVEIESQGAIALPVDIENGGTGATTAEDARTNLGLGTAAVEDAGTAVGDIPQLIDVGGGVAGLPAVDGSQLLNIDRFEISTSLAVSGTVSADFTGIPAWVKKITLSLEGVSTNGTVLPRIRIGDSGGLETSGYTGAGSQLSGASLISTTAFSSGFNLVGAWAASIAISGNVTLALLDASTKTWTIGGTPARDDGLGINIIGGVKSLTGTLDRLSVTMDGVDTFDAGKINVLYEG